jgi:DNA processing protein
VLPTPIDSPGPKQNRALFDRILEGGGAWCSKLLEPGGRSAFRERNDIVAALADLTLVVEARDPSGTRYTADAARRIGRPLWVVPWAMTDPRGSGARALIPKGANVLATTADLLRALDVPVAAPRRRRAKPSGSLDASILARLRDEPASAEALCTHLRTPLAPILTALTTLELFGLVEERGGRFFVP